MNPEEPGLVVDPLVKVLKEIRDVLRDLERHQREMPWRDVVHAIRELNIR